ncbi:MAG: DsrE/DsrF/DrsH-like family protein [bacterium]
MDTTKKTIIVFSGDLDKALAAFIIATGAAAGGDEVTMFFTFWGLNILRRPEKIKAGKKSMLQGMFGRMMPRGPQKLGLSKMNFAGMGAPLMKIVMKQQNIMPLDELVASAKEQGVRFVACTQTMDMMGFKKEELMDGLEYEGVSSYLATAEEASINLFI